MKAQRSALSVILQTKAWELLADWSESLFWSQIHGDIYRAITGSIMGGGSATPDEIRNKLHEIKVEGRRLSALGELNTILATKSPIDPETGKHLREEYADHIFQGLSEKISDPDGTTETRTSAVSETYEALHAGAKGEIEFLPTAVDAYASMLSSGEQTEIKKKTIELKSDAMRSAFQGRIYPVLQIIAARPGFSKTQLANNLALEMAELGHPGLILSQEDSREAMRDKMIAIRTGIDYKRISNGELAKDEIEKIKSVGFPNIRMSDTPHTSESLLRIIHRECTSRKVGWVVIDYLQAIRYPRGRGEEPHSLAEICIGLRNISRKYLIPVILLSQVTKDKTTFNRTENDETEINLSLFDLRGSQAIEDCARQIYLLDGVKTSPYRRMKAAKTTYGGYYEGVFNIDKSSGQIITFGKSA